MKLRSLLVIPGAQVAALLTDREHDILGHVRRAYELHAVGATSLPHSTFLRFPESNHNRIIALPAHLAGEFSIAGMKWIASFPDNKTKGLDRAAAVIVLNSLETGYPQALLEGSLVSAKRTAASAALAAQYLAPAPVMTAGFIGCGPINFEILRFLRVVHPTLSTALLFDTDRERARYFATRCNAAFPELTTTVAAEADVVLQHARLVSLATTATAPHLAKTTRFLPGTTLLHISLRDLAPEIIASADNVVDDADHVCQANTSVHLAEQLVGSRNFIRGTLGDLLLGQRLKPLEQTDLTIFSPFGLGILDLAVAKLVYGLAIARGLDTAIDDFFPTPYSAGG